MGLRAPTVEPMRASAALLHSLTFYGSLKRAVRTPDAACMTSGATVELIGMFACRPMRTHQLDTKTEAVGPALQNSVVYDAYKLF